MYSKVFSVFVLFLYPILCFPQDQTKANSLEKTFNHELQFYLVNEIITAYKYQFTENSAFRLKLNVTGLFNDENSDRIEYYEKNTDSLIASDKREYIYSNHFFEITLQYLYNAQLHKIIHLYFGGGPFVNYSFIQNENYYQQFSPSSQQIYENYSKNINNVWNIGLSVVVGLESIVYENINFFAEYEAIFEVGWRSVDDYYNGNVYTKHKKKYKNLGYNLRGIRLGVGICF